MYVLVTRIQEETLRWFANRQDELRRARTKRQRKRIHARLNEGIRALKP